MSTRFNLFRSALLFFLVSVSVACSGGGDGGGSGPVDSTPSISNLQFSPSIAFQNEGGGTLTVVGTFDFADQGGDLSTLYITFSDGSTLSAPIDGSARPRLLPAAAFTGSAVTTRQEVSKKIEGPMENKGFEDNENQTKKHNHLFPVLFIFFLHNR